MAGHRAAVAAAALAGCALAAGCTAAPAGPSPSPTPPPPAPTATRTLTQTPGPNPTPLASGPTRSAAGTCRLVAERTVADDVGMRLARVSEQRSGGRTVGCRFYALQHPNAQCDATCLANEHLPPPHQPAVRISLQRYGSSTDAHNAMVLRSRTGTGVQPVSVGRAGVGLAFQTRFYPKDHGRDWACAVAVGPILAVVETVTTNTSYNAVAVARHLAAKIA